MKKIVSLLLILVILFSLASCGTKSMEPVVKTDNLTAENAGEYLKATAKVTKCDLSENMFGYYNGGEAEIEVQIINTSGAEFKNATVTCEIKVSGNVYSDVFSGWEFESGNRPAEGRYDEEITREGTENSKTIYFDLPVDGSASSTEKLTLCFYKGSNVLVSPKLSDLNIEVKVVEAHGLLEVK
jgi:uncharacterized protein YfaS (alpha-2-macroglobulin family)